MSKEELPVEVEDGGDPVYILQRHLDEAENELEELMECGDLEDQIEAIMLVDTLRGQLAYARENPKD